MSKFMKIRPVGAEFLAGGQSDMAKLIVAFRSFVNAPNNGEGLSCSVFSLSLSLFLILCHLAACVVFLTGALS